jgi:ATP-binding cassette subfamily B (MDR/TAP) protein 1
LNYQAAIGENCGAVVQVIGQFACALVISFVNGWLLTFVVLATVPIILFATYFNMTLFQGRERSFLEAYSAAGARV